MNFPKTIAARLILAVTFSASAIFAIMLGFNHLRSLTLLEKEVAGSAYHLAQASVERGTVVLGLIARITENMARELESRTLHDYEMRAMLRQSLENNAEIYGHAVAFEADATDLLYAPYFYRKKDKIVTSQLEENYDYLSQDWYQIPRETAQASWSEPYYDEGGGEALMTTYSVPFYEGVGASRRIRGIITADVDLAWLTQLVGEIKVLKTGYAFLLSRNGTMVTHPRQQYIMNESIFSLAEARNDAELREAGRAMLRGESGFTPFREDDGRLVRLYYAPIPSAGWTLVIVFPEDELFADIRRMTFTVAGIGLVGILLITLMVVLISRSITRPLRLLASAAEEMSEGNFAVQLPANLSRDEVGTLGRAFGTMNRALQEHIRQLVAATAERERIEGDLRIAHNIQMSILPRLLHGQAFMLHAVSEPAREVGGDFYDFFLIDETHLALVIADVSGKGLPAAIFMAVAKTLIKASAQNVLSPADILNKANAQLACDNEQSMFVTVFLGILDLNSGELLYANAGHNPPVLFPAQGEPVFLPCKRQLVLGVMEDYNYRNESLQMTSGDRLFLYTDGVTEAENTQGEFYSDEHLLAQVGALQQESIQGIGDGVVKSVKVFAGNNLQSDDITLLIAEFNG